MVMMNQQLENLWNQHTLDKLYVQRILSLMKDNKPNGELQKFFYERWDQTTQNNGAAKYIDITQQSLYANHISTPEKNILDKLKVAEHIAYADNVIDLGPWDGYAAQFLHSGQTYRPVDISPYVIDLIKKNKHILTEGTLSDWFKTKIFNEAKSKAYIFLKTIPNLNDEEIVRLLSSMTPNEKWKTRLAITYFPSFNENTKNQDKIKAIYGDSNVTNPFADEITAKKSEDRVLWWFYALGFPKDAISFHVEYDQNHHRILQGVLIKANISIDGYTWFAWEKILPFQSRRISADHIKSLALQAWWKIKHQERDAWIAGMILEKQDETRRRRKVKNIVAASIAGLLLTGAITYWVHADKQKKQEYRNKLSSTLKDDRKNLTVPMPYTGDGWSLHPIDSSNNENYITAYTLELVNIFKQRYVSWYIDEEDLKLRLLEYTSKQDFWDLRNKNTIEGVITEQLNFLDTIFVPQNKILLNNMGHGMSDNPYPRLYEHQDIATNMLHYTWEKLAITNQLDPVHAMKVGDENNLANYKIINLQSTSDPMGMNLKKQSMFSDIWLYTTIDGTTYSLGLLDVDGKYRPNILVAAKYNKDRADEVYTTDLGELVAKDYFELLKRIKSTQ